MDKHLTLEDAMSNLQNTAQAHASKAHRNNHSAAAQAAAASGFDAQPFSTGNFYNSRSLPPVSRHQLELLRYANLQALRILARD
jgi:hypothetical protein